MSDWGGGRFGDVRATSAVPLIADVRGEDREVRKVPTADIASSEAGSNASPMGAILRHRALSCLI